MYRFKVFEFLVVYLLVFLPDLSCSNSDSLALLTRTLKSVQRVACDDEEVSLSCPTGTSISIQVAQYGDSSSPDNWVCRDRSNGTQHAPSGPAESGSTNCRWPNTMQYSLLQTVVEACQKKPQCKFATRQKDFVDPCPGSRKYVEVRFKCRPYEFRSKTGCEHESVSLSCNPMSRVAVLEAQYGRNRYEAGQCPQPPGVPDEACSSPYATQTVVQHCHGKRRCEVVANSTAFGNPCQLMSRTYLKIVYTCVPLGVLDTKYESPPEPDEMHVPTWSGTRDGPGLFDETGSPGERWSESSVVPPAPAAVNPILQTHLQDINGPPQATEKHMVLTKKRNDGEKESKVYTFVYVGVAVTVVFALIAIAVAVKCYYLKRTKRQTKSPDAFTTDLPNVFNDGLSDIDNDVDVSHISGTFYDPIHPDMILYRDANRGSLRAVRPMSTIYPCAGASMYGNVDYVPSENRRRKEDEDKDVVVSPKSLSRYSTSQFYYG